MESGEAGGLRDQVRKFYFVLAATESTRSTKLAFGATLLTVAWWRDYRRSVWTLVHQARGPPWCIVTWTRRQVDGPRGHLGGALPILLRLHETAGNTDPL